MADRKCATVTDFMEVLFCFGFVFSKQCGFFTKDPFTKNTLDCPKLQNWKKSQFRSAPDDACESRCSGCCDSVVLQGLLSIAELGREEGELGAFVSLPTLRNPVSWVRPLQIKKLTLRIWDSWNKCMIVGVWFYFLYIFFGGGGDVIFNSFSYRLHPKTGTSHRCVKHIQRGDFYSFGMPGPLNLLFPIQQYILLPTFSPLDSVCGSGVSECPANNETTPKRRQLWSQSWWSTCGNWPLEGNWKQ